MSYMTQKTQHAHPRLPVWQASNAAQHRAGKVAWQINENKRVEGARRLGVWKGATSVTPDSTHKSDINRVAPPSSAKKHCFSQKHCFTVSVKRGEFVLDWTPRDFLLDWTLQT